MQGQAALAELKHEFEALTTELLADGQLGDAAPGAPSPRLLAQAAAAQQRALPGESSSRPPCLLVHCQQRTKDVIPCQALFCPRSSEKYPFLNSAQTSFGCSITYGEIVRSNQEGFMMFSVYI